MERAKRERTVETTELADESSLKRKCLNSSSKQYALALLKLDCQYVYLREYLDIQNIMREQRRIIARQEYELQQSQLPSTMDSSILFNDSILQPHNGFYHHLCSMEVKNWSISHLQKELKIPNENRRSSIHPTGTVDYDNNDEEIEQLNDEIEKRDKEIEELKYNLIVDDWCIDYVQDMSTKLDNEKKRCCEMQIQSSERLEQLVSLQTRIRLDQQASSDISARVTELEEERIKLQRLLHEQRKENESLKAQLDQANCELQNSQKAAACNRADYLLQREAYNTLNSTLQQKNTDNAVREMMKDDDQILVKQIDEMKKGYEEKDSVNMQLIDGKTLLQNQLKNLQKEMIEVSEISRQRREEVELKQTQLEEAQKNEQKWKKEVESLVWIESQSN